MARLLNLNDPNEVVVLIMIVVPSVFCGPVIIWLCCACVVHGLGANTSDFRAYRLLSRQTRTIPVDMSPEYV